MSTTLGQTLEELAEQRGIEQGELAASRRLLCRLLEDRFGPLPDELRHRIHQVKDLHAWSRLLWIARVSIRWTNWNCDAPGPLEPRKVASCMRSR
jgi:hypothetical protein